MLKKSFVRFGSVIAAAGILCGCATVNKSTLQTAAPVKGADILVKTALSTNEKAYEGGKAAAMNLKKSLNGKQPHAILMIDCYDSVELKEKAIDGVASVFSKDLIFGGAVYGMYTQEGATSSDGIALMAIAGKGVQVQAALVENMGAKGLSIEKDGDALSAALKAGGANLASQFVKVKDADFMILMGDAHSPKNQYLIDGVQKVAGTKLPVTGGSISKNDGLTYVYYRGEMYSDSAMALLMKGDITASQQGRKAMTNEAVIATASEGSKKAVAKLGKEPFALIAYDCAGRMGKLWKLEDELKAIKESVGTTLPIFGSYCAGEFGPADPTVEKSSATPVGRGWHVMFSALGQKK